MSWLNPAVRKDAEFLRAGATVCLKNGPIPAGLVTVRKEPGAWGDKAALVGRRWAGDGAVPSRLHGSGGAVPSRLHGSGGAAARVMPLQRSWPACTAPHT